MAQIIEVPGQGRIEFPDGMKDADIVAAIKRLSAPKAEPTSRMDRFQQGMRDPIDGGAQLLTKMLPDGVVKAGNQFNNWLADKTGLVGKLPEGGVDQQVRKNEEAYQAKRAAAGETGMDWARIGGNVANPLNLAAMVRLPQAATLAGRVGIGVGSGAASGALTPVGSGDFATEKAKQVGMGAATGGVFPAVTSGVARVISPNASTNPQLQMLRDAGVNPSLGQTLGGWANRVEEKATSLPLVGDMISARRSDALAQFNNAAINRATAPIGQAPTGIGQAGVQQAGDALTSAYTAARNALGSFRLDQQGLQDIGRIRQMVNSLPEAQRRSFNTVFNEIRTDISPNGTIDASVFKRIDGRLGAQAARFSGSTDPYHQQLGDAFAELQRSITGAGRRANPQADAMFAAADQGWANLVRVEGASKAAMNNEGVFTPAQLNAAVRQSDTSVRDRATARGTALMQDLSTAGQQVLGNRVPNSGTPDRLMLGGAGLGAYFVDPSIPAGLLAGSALYTTPAQALLRGAVSARPQSAQSVAESLRQASPALIPGASQVGLGLLSYYQ